MTIRVLVVDDSALMRKLISEILNKDPEIEVIAIARNGRDAIEKVERLRPDVVTLDYEMPVLDGLNALGYIMSECPTPVVMLSAFGEKDAEVTLTAFEFGAVDFICKPSGPISRDIETIAQEICSKVKTAAIVDLKNLKFMEEHIMGHVRETIKPVATKISPLPEKKVILVGSSTGGPRALEMIIPKLPADLPAPVLIVQHMPPGFTKSLSIRLDSHSSLNVKEARDGDVLQKGTVYLAPGGHHMEIAQTDLDGTKQQVIRLNQKQKEKGVRPSINVLLRSAAPIYGPNVLSVILTGMGNDGAEGVELIKKMGGRSIAQDEGSCIVYGMPKAIVDRGLADLVVPLERMAEEIMNMLN